ncbi:SICA antigen [Plasmodium coatneyi]|uniref:SICA antigen n=1 Tax=Plasmodium coatneyi TaxID=208452 RepID=A0A1B1DX04_9APIC|nr:SICA antigen [Plasmodium coatneyi]ANQ07341.1 SICA antigen [Plasmodium coatneyi]
MATILGRILNKWLEDRRKHNSVSVDQRISNNVQRIVGELMRRLNDNADEISKRYCAQDPTDEIEIENNHKPICKALMRTFFYMNGLKVREGRKIEFEEDTEEESFLKCIVGTTVMLRMLKKYCWFKDYLEYALRIAGGRSEAQGATNNYGICGGMNFDQLKIGNILVGEAVAKLVEGRDSQIADYVNLKGRAGEWCRGKQFGKVKRKVPRKSEEKEKEWMSESEMKNIVENKQYVPAGNVDTVLDKIEKKIKKKKTPYECPGSTTTKDGSDDKEDLGIEEWFTTFSSSVSSTDKDNYKELDSMLALCEDDDASEGGVKRKEYKGFCEIMMRNIMIVTEVGEQYKNKNQTQKQGQTPCEKEVKNIPLCDLLNFWTYYMQLFCVPQEVIQYAFNGVGSVRGDMNPGEKYVKCAYDAAFKIPKDNERYTVGEARKLFLTSELYTMMKALTKKEWCEKGKGKFPQKASEGLDRSRSETGGKDLVVSGNGDLKKLEGIVQKVVEGLKQEEKEKEEIFKQLEETIKEAVPNPPVHHQQQPPPPPPPEPARPLPPVIPAPESDPCDGELKTRVDAAAKKWLGLATGRNLGGIGDDIQTRVNDLSGALSKAIQNEDQYCKGSNWENNASGGTSKKACEFTVRGLHHVYSITEDIQNDGRNAKANWEIKTTVACLAFNAYVQKVKEKCESTEEGIKQAFKDGKSLHEELCSSKGCEKCERSNCTNYTIEGTDLWNEVNTKLQANREIMGTLDTICNQTAEPAKPAATKPATTKPAVPVTQNSAQPGKENIVNTEDGIILNGVKLTCNIPEVSPIDKGFEDDSRYERGANSPTVTEGGAQPGATQEPASSGTSSVASGESVGSGGTHQGVDSAQVPGIPSVPDSDKNAKVSGPSPDGTTGQVSPGPAGQEPNPVPSSSSGLTPSQPASAATTAKSSSTSVKTGRSGPKGGAGGILPLPLRVSNPINHSDLTPYLPLAPVLIGISAMSYLLWKYFFLGKRRKRYKRAHQVRGPPSLEEHFLHHVDQDDGPHEYTLVKERKQPRSVPTGRTKRPKKRADRHGVGLRTIIDIHLEVLNECQKGDAQLTKEDFFEILIQEFMGNEFMKEENIPKEDVLKEQVPSSDSGFRKERLCSYGRFCS